jgi:hypothetical protein
MCLVKLKIMPAWAIKPGSDYRSPILIKKNVEQFSLYKEKQKGSGAKSYIRKGFLICKEMRQHLVILYMR